jgi:predicted PurR-regulated permease PerM
MHPEQKEDLEIKLLCSVCAIICIVFIFFIGIYTLIITTICGGLILYRTLNQVISRTENKWIDN